MAPPWRDGHSHMVNQEHLSSLTSALKAMEANTPRRRCVVSTRRVVLVALCAYPRLSVTILSALQLPHNRHRRRCPWRAGAMHWAQYDGGALGGGHGVAVVVMARGCNPPMCSRPHRRCVASYDQPPAHMPEPTACLRHEPCVGDG